MGKKKYSKSRKGMSKCMSDWTGDHPKGRGDVDDPHKQAVAVCLNKTGQSNEGMSFKEFLELFEKTYAEDAPHREAFVQAAMAAREAGSNALIVRRGDEYQAVPPGVNRIPAGFDIWAEVTPRGKIKRVGRMY